ncbi:MAG: glycine/betaine ABC transporter ATP-binding protein [Chloroflexi bacterium]|nr:glycine/betaine ABC transporter ATP-binding protein [Chloroflexota bacterium]|tara:strand:- start:3179 stop:4027 length:849 start_codon:yes stop_codon:yes gene_type:complete
MKETHIEVQNLWKVFGKNPSQVFDESFINLSRSEIQSQLELITALRDVSFTVNKGETFVVMGLSGSGKSTLVRCLTRLIDPTDGNILIDGENIVGFDENALREFRRNKIAMVFQQFGLLPHRNVLDNAAFGLEIRGIDKETRYSTAEEMLDLVGLEGWGESRVYELSGGMQQRVGIARALAVNPEIMLMDEPFSGLDPLIRRQMRKELTSLQQEIHKTMVFITHDLEEAVSVGDKIAIMRDGEIIQLGTPLEIINKPADDFVAEFTEGITGKRFEELQAVGA